MSEVSAGPVGVWKAKMSSFAASSAALCTLCEEVFISDTQVDGL